MIIACGQKINIFKFKFINIIKIGSKEEKINNIQMQFIHITSKVINGKLYLNIQIKIITNNQFPEAIQLCLYIRNNLCLYLEGNLKLYILFYLIIYFIKAALQIKNLMIYGNLILIKNNGLKYRCLQMCLNKIFHV